MLEGESTGKSQQKTSLFCIDCKVLSLHMIDSNGQRMLLVMTIYCRFYLSILCFQVLLCQVSANETTKNQR